MSRRWCLVGAAAVLAALTLPAQPSGAQAPTGSPTPAPSPTPATRAVGTMSDLMIDLIYPTSDALFYIETRTPTNDAEWNALRAKALTLAESANLLMMPGRARDTDRWMSDAKLLLDVGTAAFRAAKRQDVAALVELNDQLYQSCVTCHQHYRVNYGRR